VYCKFDLDQRSLVRALDDQTVKSYKLAFPDKYPIKVDFYRSGTPYSVNGFLKATLKPINQQTSPALAVMQVAASGTSAEGVLSLATNEIRGFVKQFGERPAALELLVLDSNLREIASWTVNCEVSRRYTGTDDVTTDLPDSKATQQEAEQGLSNLKWMTPLRVKQALLSLLRSFGIEVI
jgi:hypothetical protein